jgi:hypothetical protein
MAAPAVIGPCVTWDWSFSLVNTPGDRIVSIFVFCYLFDNKY